MRGVTADFSFFASNMTKILHGAWFPLVIAGLFFAVMITWNRGRKILGEKTQGLTMPLANFLAQIAATPPQKIAGQAFFLTRSPDLVPAALVQNLRHNKVLHSEVYFLNIRNEDIPRVQNFEKIEVEKLAPGIHRIIAHFGFMEQPKLTMIFDLCRSQGLSLKMESASFFLGREKLSAGAKPVMPRWRTRLFLFLSRNAMDAAGFFDIPDDQVLEVGARLEL